ncbi:pyridoxamine 5'-phosphate oxidase family protein [Amycolatopsis jiangsuensis]|uniref:Nitroimidazol reductase NimA-like FMN-containing flavoprotein (Pyridoxamine 5'-phosphate oxidase superfamily) n=1 Tax=Amycolatopsis jiangsuensis TaxID=1181879 RepID=A0A840IS86_9PSEU|nr:pyridoxamine 5'-phosphate oxidase family protein [Amycolatopsis jiangsuensis]MBB4685471.1 nitroimidazol reductase NimA-like FMN-containing flavoprotein (pyridoxamine 5'-phosphate oxidase superfamily) [Amycolatopsis jiangsuensis]
MTSLSPTTRTTLGRKRNRAASDRETLYAVLDEALICHLGVVHDGTPLVLPTGYGRDGDTLYLHGSTGAASLRTAAGELDVCVTVTLVDGIVYCRSLNNHSMNYRSAVIFGRARALTGRDEKMHGLRVLTDHLAPGSWEHSRGVNAKEFAAVSVLALDLSEASVKLRAEGPDDEPEDVAADAAWAGVLPIRTVFGEPEPSADLPSTWSVPEHVRTRVSEAAAQ